MSQEASTSKENINQISKGQLVRLILKNNALASFGNIIAAFILAFLLKDHVNNELLLLWLFLMFIVTSLRLIAGKELAFRINKNEKNHNNMVLFLSVISVSVVWGLAGFLFLQDNNPPSNSYILMIVTGIIAASVGTISFLIHYYAIYILITILPVFLHNITSNEVNDTVYAFLLLFFALFMIKIAINYKSEIISNLLLNKKNTKLISELKEQNNEIKAVNELKTRFLSNMSHELRTPINSALGFVHLLQEEETNPVKVNYLNIIHKSNKELLNKVDHILNFSDLVENNPQFAPHNIDIKQIIEQVIEQYQDDADQEEIKIKLITSPNLPAKIKQDAHKIQQVVAAFLSNAIKFSDAKSTISIDIEYSPKKQLLTLKVTDQGKGIDENKLDYIILPFTQEDLSETREHDGQGLGLTISHKLIKLLGGELKVTSGKNKGSCFYFSIPAPSINKKESKSKKLIGHVLIVEDNKTSQLLISKLVKSAGLTFDLADDGTEAVDAFKRNKYDLILMDENMPKMTGIEATKEIRQLETGKDIKIIALTANTLKGDKEKFLAAGMDYYFKKPLEIAEFYNLLKEILPQN